MSPFLPKGSKTYKGRFVGADGVRVIRSLGTRNKREAALIEAWGKTLRERRDWRTLGAIITGAVSAVAAYDAAQAGTLAALLDRIDREASEQAEPDLDALVGEWAASARSPKYVTQVRTLIRAGERFPASAFTRGRISKHLAGLTCNDPTRNRYRVAFSQFARWLVEREVLASNPVREVRGFKERDPRMVHYTVDEARAVLRRLPHPQNVLEAFMFGAGLEWGAVIQLRRRDVDTKTREVHARGTKTRWRTRTVRVTDPYAWGMIAAHVSQFTPDAPLFAGLTERKALEVHKQACERAGVAVSTLHDWRHTYAVQALRDGLPPQTVKRQLGHSPHSTMLERVYGAWIPKTDDDYKARADGAKEKRA